MTRYQVRFWFESNSAQRTGEQVVETIEAENPQVVAEQVAARMAKPLFAIMPSFGPAQQGGLVVINSAQVKYVEIVPPDPSRF